MDAFPFLLFRGVVKCLSDWSLASQSEEVLAALQESKSCILFMPALI